MKLIFIILLITLISSKTSPIFLNEEYEAGTIPITKAGSDIFYWMFYSRQDKTKDPLVIWLTGGPGCSSELAIMVENGPFRVSEDLELTKNPDSWNNKANVLFVDQPVGTGFSNIKSSADYVKTEAEVSADFWTFLVKFYDQYPQFKGRDLYVTGESYAGHYVPAISNYIFKQNNKDIVLKGSAIGNGLVAAVDQYPAYVSYAYEHQLINGLEHVLLEQQAKACVKSIKAKSALALPICQGIVAEIAGVPSKFNLYDIRKPCVTQMCYDFSRVVKFVNKEEVKRALGVENRKWETCNMTVHSHLMNDWFFNLENQVNNLLAGGIKVLVYSGDQDFICNWRGGEEWTNALKWDHKEEWSKLKYKDWNNKSGQHKQFKNLRFLRIYDAGHMVPMDQPKVASFMLNEFIGQE